jgi:poly-gamma-glutamate biosynthesis protein PgsC/CapC
MTDAEIITIGLGLVLSLVFAEFFGVAPGGIIVPGYLALGLADPLAVGITLAIAGVTFFIVRALATVTILYGRRRTVLMILIGFLLGTLLRAQIVPGMQLGPFAVDVVGYIVPGLIAIWLDRQGIVPTLAALVTSSVVVRLVLILAVPEDLQWFQAQLAEGPVAEEVER